MARWKNINGVLQKIAGSVRIDQVLNKLSRNAISNKAVSEKFETVDSAISSLQPKTMSQTIAGQTTVEEALATIYGSTPRFVNFSAGATSRPTSGWVATEDCYLVYSIGYVKNQVDTALNIDGNQVARITTDTGSASLQGGMFIKKGQRIALGGYSPTGSLLTYPLL